MRRPFPFLVLVLAVAIGSLACDAAPQPAAPSDPAGSANGNGEPVGSVTFALNLGGNVHINGLTYQITGANFSKTGTVNLANSSTLSTTIAGIPAGSGYTIDISGTDVDNKLLGCDGSAPFSVTAGTATPVSVHLTCHERPAAVAAVPIGSRANVAIAVLLMALGTLAVARRSRHFL